LQAVCAPEVAQQKEQVVPAQEGGQIQKTKKQLNKERKKRKN